MQEQESRLRPDLTRLSTLHIQRRSQVFKLCDPVTLRRLDASLAGLVKSDDQSLDSYLDQHHVLR